MTVYYGTQAGPGPSYFYTWADYQVVSYNDDNVTIKWRRGIEVSAGSNFYNTTLRWDDWCDGVRLGTYMSEDTDVYISDWGQSTINYGGDYWNFAAGYRTQSGYEYESVYDRTVYFNPPTYVPYAPTALTHTRSSDTTNVLSWTNNAHAARPYTNIVIERKTNAGSWSVVATINGSSTSYTDSTCAIDNYYSYRIKATNSAGGSSYTSATTATYNTPKAPSSITLSRSSATNVNITFTNTSNTATSLELQRSTDNSTWTTVKTVQGLVTSTTDNPGGGTFYYRARNARGALNSAWITAQTPIQTRVPPAAPTLLTPQMSKTLPVGEPISFSWQHNPLDGSAQTNAQIQYRKGVATGWTDLTTITGTSMTYTTSAAFADANTVEWRARTKGSDPSYGNWSSTNIYYVKNVPSVAITSPVASAVITALPITVSATYNDTDGTLVETIVYIREPGETTPIFSKSIGATLSTTLNVDEVIPQHGETYVIGVSCRSSSSLIKTVENSISISYTQPQLPDPVIAFDAETGYVNLTLSVDAESSAVPATSISLKRMVDGTTLDLVTDAAIGTGYVDKYAPINKTYTYTCTTKAASGSISTKDFTVINKSGYFYCYYGTNYSNVAKARWTPTEAINYKRPSKTRVYYAGRKYPLSYDTVHREETRTFTAELMQLAEAEAFRDMVEIGGRCIYKNGTGDVIPADVDITLTPIHKPYMYGALSCNFVRIDSGAL